MPESQPPDIDSDCHPVARAGQALARYYVHGYHRLVLLNRSTIPREGPAILVCNHISGLDPLLIQQVASHRLIRWMMAREYYDFPLVRRFFDCIGTIPVDRTGRDFAATRGAMRLLADRRLLGMFPEGRIGTAGEVMPFETGIGLLAIRSGASVYPLWLHGSMLGSSMAEVFLYPQKAALAFGPPVEFDRTGTGRQTIEAATAAIRAAVVCLAERFRPAVGALFKR